MKATFAFIFFIPVLACMWDNDTLEMERQRFPDVLELITGKFIRHSPEFYRWRIEDRTKKLAQEPDKLEYLDDLAVAYDKVGERQKAIELMLESNKKKNNRYETLANLGTFYIHNGELEKGVQYIKHAIEINPDAHFGREIYQQLFVEYILEKRGADGKLELPNSKHSPSYRDDGFALYALKKRVPEQADSGASQEELKKQLKGLLGIMKFGTYDSPLLLEVTAFSLMANNRNEQQIASRAFLKASYGVKDPEQAQKYREFAESVLSMQQNVKLSDVEKQFKDELKDADEWYAQLRQDELNWIKEGGDVDAKFAAKYYADPQVPLPPGASRWDALYRKLTWELVLTASLFIVLSSYLTARIMRRLRPKF